MKYIELQEAFEIEINKLDDGLTKPKSIDTEWWLNRGLEKFYKTRYSGINFKQKGFEQDQKRIDDLRTLVQNKIYQSEEIIVDNSINIVTLPDDYVILLGDTAGILPPEKVNMPCWKTNNNGEYIVKYSDTIEGKIETIDRQLENSLSEHRLKYCSAKPIRLIKNNQIYLYTDGKYRVSEYSIDYLRRPLKIDIHKNPMDEYTDMPEHTHAEIVKIAAQMYLENQSEQRYSSISNEVKEME